MGERFNVTELEVTDEVFESARSGGFRTRRKKPHAHTIKAVMLGYVGRIIIYDAFTVEEGDRHSGGYFWMCSTSS